jgi:heterodisulfide reductase subunit B2
MTSKTYTYYPGCSLQHGNHAYEVANRAVAKRLGLELVEVEDWNCCGATEYMSLNRLPAYALIARNLAQAADSGAEEVVAPCSACFLNLHKTDKQMKQFPELAEKVNQALEAGNLHYDPGTLHVRHLLEAIITDVGYDELKAQTKRPLYGLKLAPYYGCLVARPDSVFDSTEQPTAMDHMLEALSAEVPPFSLKTFCCGGHMTQISEETALEMIHRIIHNAVKSGADAIVTICPMCQLNLDLYQGYANQLFDTDYEMPILFFTQAIGLAMGISPKDLGAGQEFVSMDPVVEKIQDVPPPKPRRQRRSKKELPMPIMPE